jgi:hypothetical protein
MVADELRKREAMDGLSPFCHHHEIMSESQGYVKAFSGF